MMTQEVIQGNWNSIVGAIKQKFGEITNDDLARVQGNVDQLIGLIQRKFGHSRQQVEQLIDQCLRESNEFAAQTAVAAGQAASHASKLVSDAASEVSQSASDGYKFVADRAGEGFGYAKQVVERRPVESVVLIAGASLIAGVLVGLSLGSRPRS